MGELHDAHVVAYYAECVRVCVATIGDAVGVHSCDALLGDLTDDIRAAMAAVARA
jgi:hypothetical protein